MKERIMAETQEIGGSASSAEPKVVVAGKDVGAKGPGFWNQLLGTETKPLVLVKQEEAQLPRAEQGEPTEPVQPGPPSAETQAPDATPDLRPGQAGTPPPEQPPPTDGERREPEGGEPADWWPFGQNEWDYFKDVPQRRPVVAVRYYHNLPNAERRTNEVKMKQAYDRIDSYSIRSLVYSTEAEVADLKDQLADDDLEIIRQYAQQLQQANDPQAAEKVGDFRNKLHNLDILRTGLKSVEDLSALDAGTKLRLNLTEEDWQSLADRRQSYSQQTEGIEREISQLVGQEFVTDRNEKIIQVQNLEIALERAKAAEKERLKAEFSEVEEDQELQLINEIADENLTSFTDTVTFIEQQRNLQPAEQDTAGLEQAQARLAWYFYTAKQFGLTADLESAGEKIYLTFKELYEERRVGMQALTNLTRDIEAVRTGLLTDRNWVIRVMASAGLRQLPPGFAEKFRGIREAYFNGIESLNLYGASGQIEYQIQRTIDPTMPDIQDMIDQGLIRRLPGEFNIRIIEADPTLENRPHYQMLYGTMVDLPGETEEDVDKGIDEYTNNLLYGSGAFDIQTIYQKMNQLGDAIERASLRLKFQELTPEATPKDEADFIEKYANKRRQAYNRIIFIMAQHEGNNLNAPGSAGLLKRQALRDIYKDGYESYRELLKDPDVLISLYKLYTEYTLYFTPVGHKGQLINKAPAQYGLRGELKELLIDDVVNWELTGDPDDPDRLNRLTRTMTDLEIKTLFRKRFTSLGEKYDDYKNLTLKEALEKARAEFHDPTATPQVKRLAREKLRVAKTEFYGRQKDVQAKVNLAIAVMDSLGESAQLGAPAVIMDNGDYIRMDDMTLAGKYAVLEKARELGDNPALIRWRQRMWKDAWKEAGLDRAEARIIYASKVREQYSKIGLTPPAFMFGLVEGFEETGIVTAEWQAFLDVWKKIRKDGFTAVLDGNTVKVAVTFEDVLKMDQLKDVRNNFIAAYTSASNIAISPIAIREAKKGNDPYLWKLLKRLDETGRAKFSDLDIAYEEGKLSNFTPEQIKELFEDAISDSYIFHFTVRTLTRHMATRPKVKDFEGNSVYATKNPLIDPDPNNHFSSDNVDFGFPGQTWLFERLRSYPDYIATNKRERIGRGIEILPWLDTHLTSLSEYLACDNILELIWNFNKQFVDQWVLTTFPEQILAAQAWRQFGETSINEENKGYFGMLDKILTDSDKLFLVFAGEIGRILPLIDQVDKAEKEGDIKKIKAAKEQFHHDYAASPVKQGFKEQVDNQLETTFSRIQPLDAAQERSLSQFKGAAGSGVGRELNELMALKIAEWVISEKQGDRREEGGALSYGDVKDIMRIIMYRDSWRPGTSLWEERWGKMTNSRSARLPSTPPIPIF